MHPRLVATFALIPITFGVEILLYLLLYSAYDPFGVIGQILGVILLLVAPVVILYGGGLLIWWRTVAWTPRKRFGVLVTSLILLLVLCVSGLLGFVDTILVVPTVLIVGLIGGGIALIVVGRICWEPPATGPDVPCPRCGYNLRGQRECRCPECGTEYTLGDLAGGSED
jgi:hypothetical protein